MIHKPQQLSARQVDVLVLLAQDNDYSEIALRLGISPATVDYHLRRLRSAFRTKTLAGLVGKAIGYGILTTTLPVLATGQILLTLAGTEI